MAQIYRQRPRLIGRRIDTEYGAGTVVGIVGQLRTGAWMVTVRLDEAVRLGPGTISTIVDVLLRKGMEDDAG